MVGLQKPHWRYSYHFPPSDSTETDSTSSPDRSKTRIKTNTQSREVKKSRHQRSPYLIAVHFKLPHDLDRNFSVFSCGILGAIDIAKGAVTHLLDQDPSFQARVFGHLAPRDVLLLHNSFDLHRAILAHLSFCSFLRCSGTISSKIRIK